MYRVFSCLAAEHDYWLVGLAAVVCICTALTAFKMYSIAVADRGLRQVGWALLTGVCAGSGIWATHFVAMLAYDGGLPVSYDPVATLASLVIATTLAACGFGLACRGDRLLVATGGAVIGVAIGSMHYVGMQALNIPGTMHWDAPLVASSLVFGVAVGSAAMVTFHRLTGLQSILAAAGLLTLAICGVHFTAMGALTVLPDPTIFVQPSSINRTLMAMAVAGVTSIVLLSALGAAIIQRANIRHETELREQNSRFEAVLRYLPVGLSMFDSEQRLIMCNSAYREIYSLSEQSTRPGTLFSEILLQHAKSEAGCDHQTNLDDVSSWVAEYFAKLACGKQFTDTQHLSDGRTIFVRIGPIAGGGWVDVQEDITERSEQEAKIAYMARHDMLTGLPNRTLLRERLDQALKSARRGENIAVLCLDLDRFKEVNDTLGHPVGDTLLKAVAERLSDSVREIDTVGRVGGDEFVIVQITSEPSKEAAALAARIIELINTPFDLSGHKLVIGTSVGIAISGADAADSETLLAQADMALYRSKSDGRATYCFFEEDMNTRMRARREIEHDLRMALVNGELQLHYQPLVNLERNEVTALEALLRWAHPRRGLVSPGEFIPIAEETGLIVPIGEWVLRQACADAATWPGNIMVAVNISPAQFKCRSLAETVFNAVAASGLTAQRLELEITESALLQDSEATLSTLRQLHNFGVRIAMDDFGTGYSSLSYLRKFPFDKLKIDRCFIASLSAESQSSLAIVRAITGLGRALGLSITAEGVETQEQLEIARSEGCTEMQGYLFSAPRPVDEARRFLPPLKTEEPCQAATEAA